MQFHGLSVRLCGGLALAAVSLCGCQNANYAQQGTAFGAGTGTLLGAIIGHQTGNKEAGALIGGAAGALTGAMAGHAKDMEVERDAAVVQAYHSRKQQQAAQRAVTNRDIISMTQQGLPDQIIIGSFAERGGRFDTSPDQLNYLNKSGVSIAVVQAMQQYNTGRY